LNGTDLNIDHDLEKLILLAQQGDKQAFRSLVEKYQKFVFAVAFKILLNDEDARDTAQDAFIKLWQHISEYKFQAKFTTWFYKIIINLCLDKLRVRKRRNAFFTNSIDENTFNVLLSGNSDDYSNKELMEIIIKLTGKLSPKQKIVFVMRDLNGFGIGEISQTINMPENSVKVNLLYARKKIKKYLTNIYKW